MKAESVPVWHQGRADAAAEHGLGRLEVAGLAAQLGHRDRSLHVEVVALLRAQRVQDEVVLLVDELKKNGTQTNREPSVPGGSTGP